jgi:hypothetical protein
MINFDELTDFAARYANARCSQDPERVAAFFAENDLLSVNDRARAVRRVAIPATTRGFMTAWPA